MEEKERYVIGKGEDIFIADNDRKVMFTITTKKLQDLLNQQDKEIKKLEEYNNKYPYHYSEEYMKNNRKLEEENQQLKQQLEESESKRKSLEEKVKWLSEENEECFIDGQKYNELREQKDKEIAKLKQSQKQLAIKELEKLKEKLSSMKWCIDSEENTLVQIIAHRVKQSEIIDNQINELREMK